MKTQIEIEEENLQIMIDKGTNNLYKDNESGRLGDTKGSHNILAYYTGELANILEAETLKSLEGTAKTKAVPHKILTMFDPVLVANFTVRSILASREHTNYANMVSKLAVLLMREYKLMLGKKDREQFSRVLKLLKKRVYFGERKRMVAVDLIAKYQTDVFKNIGINFEKLALYSIHALELVQPIIGGVQFQPLFTIKVIADKGANSTKHIVRAKWFKEY